MPPPPAPPSRPTRDLLIGALLRVPAQAIHRRLISELNRAGFAELTLAHMPVLQYPGPDGARPSALAERAGMTKQAMNQLLRSLEGLGYIARRNAPTGQAGRVVGFTPRGQAAFRKTIEILRGIEQEWSEELGPRRLAQLKQLLGMVWESPLVRASAIAPDPADDPTT